MEEDLYKEILVIPENEEEENAIKIASNNAVMSEINLPVAVASITVTSSCSENTVGQVKWHVVKLTVDNTYFYFSNLFL